MQNAMIQVLALPDAQTAGFILSLRTWLGQQGFQLLPEVLPPHLLLSGYAAGSEQDVLRLAADAAARTRAFALNYSHVGLTQDGCGLFLAPEVNRPLLSLRERFVGSQGYLLHTPLLTVAPGVLTQVLPYVLPNVKTMEARITELAVCRGDGTVLLRQAL